MPWMPNSAWKATPQVMPHTLTFADLSLQAISPPRNLILMEIWTSQLTFLCGPSVVSFRFCRISPLFVICRHQMATLPPNRWSIPRRFVQMMQPCWLKGSLHWSEPVTHSIWFDDRGIRGCHRAIMLLFWAAREKRSSCVTKPFCWVWLPR